MQLQLRRIKSERCYLQGKLTTESEFICDTLEFNNELTLEPAIYALQVLRSPDNHEKAVYIFNAIGNPVSKLIRDNTEIIYNVKTRKKNALIEIGLDRNCYELVMFSMINKLIIERIEKATMHNEKSELAVINAISDNFFEETLTAY